MTARPLNSTHEDLSDAIERVQDGEPVLLEQGGRPLAAIVSVRDLRLLENLLEEMEDRLDIEELEKSLAEPLDPVPYDEFRKELGF